jgi:hypothetical protein
MRIGNGQHRRGDRIRSGSRSGAGSDGFYCPESKTRHATALVAMTHKTKTQTAQTSHLSQHRAFTLMNNVNED